MTLIDEMRVVVSGSTKELRKELDSLKKSLNDTGKKAKGLSVGDIAKGVFKAQVAFAALSTAIQGVTNAIKSAVSALSSFLSSAIKTSNKFENALIGLSTVAGRKLGQEGLDRAKQSAIELANDGLLTVQESADGLKNLLASGFGLEEAVNLMNTFKDAAAFGRQGSLSFGDAIVSATQGIKNGNSILVDNAGITKNLSIILEEAGYSAQDLSKATTDASVRQALYNGLLKEGNIFLGDSAKLAQTASGQQAKLSATIANFKKVVGDAVKPIYSILLLAGNAFIGGLTSTVESGKTQIQNFTTQIAGYLLGLIRFIGRLFSNLPLVGNGFKSLANLTVPVAKAQDKLANSAGGVASGLDKAKESSDDLKKSLSKLASFDELNILSGGAGGGLEGINTDLGGFNTGALDADIGNIENFAEEINGIADGVVEDLEKVWNKIEPFIERFKEATAIINKFILKPIGKLAEYLKEEAPEIERRVGVITGQFTELKEAIDPFLDIAIAGLKTGMEDLMPVLSNVGSVAEEKTGIKLKDLDTTIFDLGTTMSGAHVESVKLGSEIGILGIKFAMSSDKISTANRISSATFKTMGSTAGSTIPQILGAMGTTVAGLFGFLPSFSNISTVITSVFETLKTKVSKLFAGMVGSIKRTLNNGIWEINNFINRINSVSSPITGAFSRLGVRVSAPSVPTIPYLAQGGHVTGATTAMIGEGGYNEVVLPLDRNTGWAEKVAELIKGNGGENPMQVIVQIGEEKIYDKFVDYNNNRSLYSNIKYLNI